VAPGDTRVVLSSADEAALRAEQDALAGRVATRHSIDDVRKGAYAAFGLVMAAGLTVKFAWDRWGWGVRPVRPPGRYPLLFLGALGLSIFLAVFAATAFLRARRAMRVEDADFARLREIRARLGIDA
jgi:hypothetical protein